MKDIIQPLYEADIVIADYFEQLGNLPHKKGGGYIAESNPDQVRKVQALHELELYDIDTPEALDKLKYKAAQCQIFIDKLNLSNYNDPYKLF